MVDIIEAIKIGLYGGFMVKIWLEIIFLLVIYRLGKIFSKSILKLLEKLRGKNGNNMATNMTQWECSNIKCYVSVFSNI